MTKNQKFVLWLFILIIVGTFLPNPVSPAEATIYYGIPFPWRIVNYGGFVRIPEPIVSTKYYSLIINIIIYAFISYKISFKKEKKQSVNSAKTRKGESTFNEALEE